MLLVKECAFCTRAEKVAIRGDSRPWARDTYRCGLTGQSVDHDDTCDQWTARLQPEPTK